ncbi:hypothetical protein AMAG_10947 [Allomyces macrogynus ATCC 38327]|uniref:Uncharacterized protein n=1 Tax=Allomyces macrogynus (strain ATCC 38327) TaxID=578462 RepID=A0A0L0SSF6_ALLM3|nr:hypothetical protein AMAG_10947 [Allomyces macrogynus ATCC 38327]|eukprot:KNE65304.1 hypothetical protein AMAG_10947 [Allomyces macrogynus ATCC 38327]
MGCSALPPPRRPPRDSTVAAVSSSSDSWTVPVEQAAQIEPKVALWRPLVPALAAPHDVSSDGAGTATPAAPWSALAAQAAAVHAALPPDFAALGVTPLDTRTAVEDPAGAPEIVGMAKPAAVPARVVTDTVVVTDHAPVPAPVAADSVIRATGTATLGVPPTSVEHLGFGVGEPLAENTVLPLLNWPEMPSGTRVVRATAAATTTSATWALDGGIIISGVFFPYWTLTLFFCVLWVYGILASAKFGKVLIHKLLCIDVFHGMYVVAKRRICGSRLTKARDKARKSKKDKKKAKKDKKKAKKDKKKANKSHRSDLGGDGDNDASMRAIPTAANMDAYLAAQASMMREPAALSSSALAMGMAMPGATLTQQPGMTMPHNYTDLLAKSLEMGGTLSAGSSPRTGRRQQGGKVMRKGMSSVM